MLLCLLAGCTTRATTPAQRQQRAIEVLKGDAWYDSDKVAYRPPPVSSEFDDPMRSTAWPAVERSRRTPAPGTGAGAAPMSGLGDSFQVIVWILLGVGLIALASVLAFVSMRSWNRGKGVVNRLSQIEIDPTRVVDLPFDAEAAMDDPLGEARRLAQAGDYDAAILFLYGYMLLALDRANKIVLHRGKTNRMYQFELGGDRPIKQLLTPAMLAFEDVYFGRHSLGRDRFLTLWKSMEEFHRLLAPVMAAETAADAQTPGADQLTSASPGAEVPTR